MKEEEEELTNGTFIHLTKQNGRAATSNPCSVRVWYLRPILVPQPSRPRHSSTMVFKWDVDNVEIFRILVRQYERAYGRKTIRRSLRDASDVEFQQLYRFTKDVVHYLIEELTPDLKPKNSSGSPPYRVYRTSIGSQLEGGVCKVIRWTLFVFVNAFSSSSTYIRRLHVSESANAEASRRGYTRPSLSEWRHVVPVTVPHESDRGLTLSSRASSMCVGAADDAMGGSTCTPRSGAGGSILKKLIGQCARAQYPTRSPDPSLRVSVRSPGREPCSHTALHRELGDVGRYASRIKIEKARTETTHETLPL
ncbi:hypothetical protein EVAR_78698_1 [Eumeta japonica]|uniref:Uncharacterized protein n=1 Tax=Eumeta variegata TaxID=151549 RepID=A0A4C1T133_EUMVA|nr:hypothetical protein EVAR_78698_1 [Eumeta japonica]